MTKTVQQNEKWIKLAFALFLMCDTILLLGGYDERVKSKNARS